VGAAPLPPSSLTAGMSVREPPPTKGAIASQPLTYLLHQANGGCSNPPFMRSLPHRHVRAFVAQIVEEACTAPLRLLPSCGNLVVPFLNLPCHNTTLVNAGHVCTSFCIKFRHEAREIAAVLFEHPPSAWRSQP